MTGQDGAERAARLVALARAGKIAEAIDIGERAAEAARDDAGLRLFLGTLCCRDGQVTRGIAHFRAALAIRPDDAIARVELARALFVADDLDGVIATIGDAGGTGSPIEREYLRLRAHAAQRRGDAAGAEPLYRALTGEDRGDFESWQGLGLVHQANDDQAAAAAAFRTALRLRPGLPVARLNLGRALIALDQPADALAVLRPSGGEEPDDLPTLIEIGRACILLREFEAGERALRRALAIDPGDVDATVGLADMLERANRLDDLETLLDGAGGRGIATPALSLMRARLLRRRGRLAEALAAALADEDDDPLRAQTIGEIADQLGAPEIAFPAFERMNRLVLAASPEADADARAYRDRIRAFGRLTTPDWFAGWRPSAATAEDGRDPVFLFGFPRSGTTLLDTMLIGHPDVVVLEEEPVMQQMADLVGAAERLPRLSDADIAAARRRYWLGVDAIYPERGTRLVVDKFPLGLIGTGFIRRIFPGARFIFAERHPCDVVLSCFITRFRLNGGMSNFLRLRDTAILYDLVLDYWTRCRAVFDLPVHLVRYERMVADPRAELQPLASFLGLAWDDRLVEHRRNAAERGYIATPSYAQVTEPLYARAAGRWHRYAAHLAPVMPILAPWIERMGYALDAPELN